MPLDRQLAEYMDHSAKKQPNGEHTYFETRDRHESQGFVARALRYILQNAQLPRFLIRTAVRPNETNQTIINVLLLTYTHAQVNESQ